MVDGSALAREVLKLQDDPYAVLSRNPLGIKVTAETPIAEGRRAYMRLAAVIHPDRLPGFDKATEAFQVLVKSFETFANPPIDTQPKPARRRQAKERKPKSEKLSKAVLPDGDSALLLGAPKPFSKPKPTPKGKFSVPSARERKEDEEEDETASSDESPEDDGSSDYDFSHERVSVSLDKQIENELARPRSNEGCFRTPVACPKCRTPWQPDDNKQYSLFMRFAARVFCSTCLFQFGCVTGLHYCPHCKRPVDYDNSMYHKKCTCPHCRKDYGFMYYKLQPQLVLAIRAQAAEEEKAEKKRREREQRTRHGRQGVDEEEERMITILGQCIVEEQCPLCHQQVKSKHRAHVTECLAKQKAGDGGHATTTAEGTTTAPQKAAAPPPRKRLRTEGTEGGAKSKAVATPKAPRAKRAAVEAKPRAKRAPPAKRATKRKRGGFDSDSESPADSSSSGESSASGSSTSSSDASD